MCMQVNTKDSSFFPRCFCEFRVMVHMMPWLRRLVGGLSPRRPGFDPRPVRGRFVVDRLSLGQVFLRIIRFLRVSIIPSMFHTHLHACLMTFCTVLHVECVWSGDQAS
jgi:hypothetical protein